MKKHCIPFAAAFLACTLRQAQAVERPTLATSRAANAAASPTPDAKPFVHPGLLRSRAELDFIKRKLGDGEEPVEVGLGAAAIVQGGLPKLLAEAGRQRRARTLQQSPHRQRRNGE